MKSLHSFIKTRVASENVTDIPGRRELTNFRTKLSCVTPHETEEEAEKFHQRHHVLHEKNQSAYLAIQ